MLVNDLITMMLAATTISPPSPSITALDLRAIEAAYGHHRQKRVSSIFVASNGNEFWLASDEDQLDSLLDSGSMSERNIQALLALPLRPYVPR